MKLSEAVARRQSNRRLFDECFGDLAAPNLRVWTDLAEAKDRGASNEELAQMVRDSGLSTEEVNYLAECTRRFTDGLKSK